MSTNVAVVKSITGPVFAISADGFRRQLFEGDRLLPGEQVVTGLGGEVVLQLADGDVHRVTGNSRWQAPSSAQAETTQSESTSLEEALMAGLDPTVELDPTAAGPGGQGASGGGGHSFVLLDETAERLDPSIGFPTEGLVFGTDFTREDLGDTRTFENTSAVTLTSTDQVTEGGTITITATVTRPVTGSDLTVTLTDGSIIIIPVGQTTGSTTIGTRADDVYLQGETVIEVGVDSTQGGGYDSLDTSSTTSTTVVDDLDPTAVTLEAPAQVVEGGSITVIARVEAPPQGSDLVINLTNGQTITIAVGQTEGQVTYPARTDDQLVQGNISQQVGIATTTGGNYEQLVPGAPVTTIVQDNDAPHITVSNALISEGDSGTFNLSFGKAVDNPTTVTFELRHGTTGSDDFDLTGLPVVIIAGNPAPVIDNGDGSYSFELPANTLGDVSVRIQTRDDDVLEVEENFHLVVSQTGATENGTPLPAGLTGEGEGRIVDDGRPLDPTDPTSPPADDDRPVLVIEGGGRVAEGNTVEFTVKLIGDVKDPQPTEIALELLTGGSNTAESNDIGTPAVTYRDSAGDTQILVITDGKVTLPVGVNEISVRVPTIIDAEHEGRETFQLKATDLDGRTTNGEAIGNASIFDKPLIDVPDANDGPSAVPGHISIAEDASEPVNGSFTVTAPADLTSVSVGGTLVSVAQLQDLATAPLTITTAKGQLTLTGFDETAGIVSYEYQAHGAQDHTAGDNSVIDSFNIVVTDSLNQTSSDTLDVLITDTNPVAKDEAHTLTEDSGSYSVSGNTLANDTAFDGPVAFNGWSGTPTGQYGSFTANADGTYSYVLDNTNAAVNALNDGQTLTETFNYQVRDADGDVANASVTITINGRTDGPPVVDVPDDNGVAAGNISIAEDATTAVTGQMTVTAEAGLTSLQVGGQTLTLAELNALGTTPAIVTTAKGELTLTGYDAITGKVDYSYTVNGAQDHTAGDDSVLDSFVISITDANGQTSNDTLDVLITDTNPVAEGETHILVEDSGAYTVSGNTLTNDSAFDGPVAFNGWTSTTGQYGSFTANADGTYTYVLDNTNPAVNALNDGQRLTETFNYQVRDADGDVANASVTITINGRTDGPPVVDVPDDNGVAAGNISIAEDATTAVTGQMTVTAEAGLTSLQVGTRTITAAELNDLGANPVVLTTTKGSLTLTGYDVATGMVNYSYTVNGAQDHTAGDDSVIDSFAISITDANGQTSNDTLDVLITDTNPVAEGEIHTLVEDSGAYTVSGNTLTNDSAFDGPVAFNGWTSTTGHYGNFTANADGTYSYVLDNTNPAVNVLNDGQSLTETFNYQVRDADGDVADASVIITINGRTDGPPVVDVPDDNGVAAGNISIAEDATTAVTGQMTVTAEAGLTSLQVGGQTLTLAELNALGTTPAIVTTTKGELTLTGYDAITGKVNYSYTVNGAQDHTAGDDSVIDSFAISITDANGQTSNDTLDVLITDTNPVAEDEAHTLVEDSGAYTVSGNTLTNDSAFDGPVAFNGWSGTPTGQYGSFTANADGTYSYVLDNTNAAVNALNDGQSLTETFSYQVRDADGDVANANVTITINGRTDGPPVVDVPDDNGVDAGNISIAENATAPVTGSFTLSAEAGLTSLQVGGHTLTLAELNALGTTPAIVTTAKGELTLTGYDAITGKVDYSYTVNGAQDHTAGDDSVLDSFVISITDANGQTSNDTLDVLITDTNPVAEGETHTLVEDSGAYTVSGNTLTNDSAFDGPVAFNGWTSTAGQYGNFTANADGTYTYVLDNTNPAVNALNDGQRLTETFSYQVRDADGDVANASVTITIKGHTDSPPTVDAAGGHALGLEDTPLVLKWDDFRVSDTDSGLESLGVFITSLPVEGQLQYQDSQGNWLNLSSSHLAGEGAYFSSTDVNAGKLRFVPEADASGFDGHSVNGVGNKMTDYARFSFKPTDGDALGESALFALDIKPVVDDPSLALTNNGVISSERQTQIKVVIGDATITITGSEPPHLDGFGLHEHYNNGTRKFASSTDGNLRADGDADLITLYGDFDTLVAGKDGNGPTALRSIDGGNKDIIYLSKPRASYEISEGQLHANSGSDGWIKDLRTGVTVSINNIKGFVFGDGATMLFQSDVSSTVEVTGYDTVALTLDAALGDVDGSELLSDIVLSGLENGAEIISVKDALGDDLSYQKNADGTWTITNASQAEMQGIQLVVKVPTEAGNIDIHATVSANEQGLLPEDARTAEDSTRLTAHSTITGSVGGDSISGTDGNDIVIADVSGLHIVPGQNYNIAFIVDTSGSMGASGVANAVASLKTVLSQLQASAQGSNAGTVNVYLLMAN